MASIRDQIEIGASDQLVRLDPALYHPETLAEMTTYGRWERDTKNGRYLVPGALSGSDYSGTLIEHSNRAEWCETFEAGNGEWWTEVSGGYGTRAIVVDLEMVPEDLQTPVVEFLNGLQNYPSASDDRLCEMETEAQGEAWKDWAERKFKRAIEQRFEVDLDETDADLLFRIFSETSDHAGIYWVNEQSDSMWIDIPRIVTKVTQTDVDQLLASKKAE
jgi:hypothetical protein